MSFNANVLVFDKNNCVEDFTFILSTKSYKHLGKIANVKRETIHTKGNLNSFNEISFDIYKTLDGHTEHLWDKIIDLKSVFVPELHEYFEIKVTYNDSIDEIKKVTCTSLCEAELSQKYIYGTEINTEADINRDDYVVTTFYNEENPKASLLHRVLSVMPHYSIKYVDKTLWDLQRSFSIDGTTVYDFLVGECAEEFHCLFAFNSIDRSISVYDLYTSCMECGHRGDYNDICPKCGSVHLNSFGEDTSIFVNKENLTAEIQFETDTDAIKNCFRLVAGDDIMTTAVINQNPNGTAYLIEIPQEQLDDMSDELVEKLNEYNLLYDSHLEEYQRLSEEIYNVSDEISYYQHTMMPSPKDEDETDTTLSIAEQQVVKLTQDNLSPVGLSVLTENTVSAIVDNAIKNYARVFVNTSLVKVDVVDGSTFTYVGKDNDGWNYGEWTGALKVTCYSDNEDVAETPLLTIRVHDNYPDYLQQKVMKDIALNDKEDSVFDVLSIEDLDAFKTALESYCLSRLKSFSTAIETAMTTLMSLDQSYKDAEWYEELYVPYYEKHEACELEIAKRQATINELTAQLESLQKNQYEIQSALNFETYLGEDLYHEFCTYRREDEYNNSNYISDGLSNAEIMAKAREFIEVAKKELHKSATRQHRISCNLYNLLAMPEFKPLLNKFALGNFIRIQVGNDIYRLRLISYEISFSDLSTINVEFSDMTKTADGMNDVESVLASAQSMAKNYDSMTNQAEKGAIAKSSIDDLINNSLNAATIKIKSSVNEDVVIDNNGILGRSFDDIENAYSPKQYRWTHNLFLMTKDNWRSSELGIGEMTYTLNGKTYEDYGIITKYLLSGKIISGDIYSANYETNEEGKVVDGTHINLTSGDFTFGGGSLAYSKENGLYVNGNGTFTGIIHAEKGGTIGGWQIGESTLTGGNLVLNSEGSIKGGSDYEWSISKEGKAIFSNAEIEGKVTTSDFFSDGGTIGGFTIGASAIYNGTDSLTSTTKGIYLGTDGIRQYESDSAYVNLSKGILTANGANIDGTITAVDGKIGNWLISGGELIAQNESTDENSNFLVRLHAPSEYGSAGNSNADVLVVRTGITNYSYPIVLSSDGTFKVSKLNVTGGSINLGNNVFQVTNEGKMICSDVEIKGGSLEVGNNFIVNSTGVKISGVLTAGVGSSLGGFKTDNNSLYSGSWDSTVGTTPDVFICTGEGYQNSYTIADVSADNWCFGAGTTFGVTRDGGLYSTSGYIGGWQIGKNSLKAKDVGYYSMELYANGYTPTGSTDVFFLVMYEHGVPVGGITFEGWKPISV